MPTPQPKYTHEAFLSYARIDEKSNNNYISAIFDKLTNELNVLCGRFDQRRIFFDTEAVDKTREIPKHLKDAAGHAKVLIATISASYAQSHWCDAEREAFLGSHDHSVDGRCFLIDLGTLPRERWPREFREVPGYEFFKKNSKSTSRLKPNSTGFAETCEQLATDIFLRLQEIADAQSKPKIKTTTKSDRVNRNRTTAIKHLDAVKNFPEPLYSILINALRDLDQKKGTIAKESATDTIRMALQTTENYFAAIALAEFRRNQQKIHRTGFTNLKKQLLHTQNDSDTLLTTSASLREIGEICFRHLEKIENHAVGDPTKIVIANPLRALDAADAIKSRISYRMNPETLNIHGWGQLLTEAHETLSAIQQSINNLSLFIPTSITNYNSEIRVTAGLAFDNSTRKWESIKCNLTFPESGDDPRSLCWIQLVIERTSPLLIRSSILKAQSEKTGLSTTINCNDACSLFPFIFTKVKDSSTLEFFIYDHVTVTSKSTSPDNINTVGYVRLSDNGCRKINLQKHQEYAPVSALEQFFLSVLRASGARNLAVTPKAIASEHEYVLCSQIEGRVDELAAMDDWIADPNKPTVFCWEAFGGDGKSALVNNWLFLRPETLEHLRENSFEGAYWADFYQPNFGLIDFATEVLAKINPQQNLYTDKDVMECFFEEISSKQYLFVLDGVERLLKSEELSENEIVDLLNEYGKLPEKYRICRTFTEDKTREKPIKSINDDFFCRFGEIPTGASRFLMTTRFCPTGIESLANASKAIVAPLAPISSEAAQRIWWSSCGRKPESEEEEIAVSKAIESLSRHPLTVRILASTIGERSYLDWTRDLRTLGESNPLEINYNDEDSDSRTRCSAVIWICGLELEAEEKEFLKVIDKNFSGSVYLSQLQDDPAIVSVLGQYGLAVRSQAIAQKLAKSGWLGLSQGGLVNLHPMVRQFAKDVKDNRGYSKNQSLTPAKLNRIIHDIGQKLQSNSPQFDSAWRQISRKELWSECFKLRSNKSYASIGELVNLMLRFLPHESKESYPLPLLSNRGDQILFLFHLGELFSYLGEYAKSIEMLKASMHLGDLLGKFEIVQSCRNRIRWASLYEGEISVAEEHTDATDFDPQLEVCYALRGALSASFEAQQPSASAFPAWNDRRWLFQTLSEACFWRTEFTRAEAWAKLLKDSIPSDSNGEYDGDQGQIMWEDWTRGVLLAEECIRTKNFHVKIVAESIDYLRSAEIAARDKRYSIVAALSIAFSLRLYSFCCDHSPEYRREFNKKLADFRNSPFLHRPHAIEIVRISEVREEIIRTGETSKNLNEIFSSVTKKGNEFFFAISDLKSIAETFPNVKLPFRSELVTLYDSLKLVRPENPSNTSKQDRDQRSSPGLSRRRDQKSAIWDVIPQKYGQEIIAFKSTVELLGGTEFDFQKELERQSKGSHRIDPLAAVVEIYCKQIDGTGDAASFIDKSKFSENLSDLRESGFDDFNENVGIASKICASVSALQSSEEGTKLLDALVKDSDRLLALADFPEGILSLWRDRVPYYLRHESPRPYVFLPFFEASLIRKLDLKALIRDIRLPSRGCYRASFYRKHLEVALPIFLSSFSREEHAEINFWRSMYICGWADLDSESKKKWNEYRSRIPKGVGLRLVDELCGMRADLKLFLHCLDITGNDSPQGNLSFLRYKKRVDLCRKLETARSELANLSPSAERIELSQKISALESQFSFWEESSEQADN